ncbi:prolipoprotein diacylglyceryl transferase, partial [Vibrio parahaemolyticus V-223/04]
VYWV